MLMESQGSEGGKSVFTPIICICMLMECKVPKATQFPYYRRNSFVCLWNRKVPKGKDMLL